jgi:hypothetical protein
MHAHIHLDAPAGSSSVAMIEAWVPIQIEQPPAGALAGSDSGAMIDSLVSEMRSDIAEGHQVLQDTNEANDETSIL